MPPRLTAQDFDQELLILFDAYVHGDLDRRGFLSQAQKFAKAGVTAAGLLAALSPNFAAGQQVAQGRRAAEDGVRRLCPRPPGAAPSRATWRGRPRAGTKRLPAVLVIHENRGLNPHIEDITRRLALDGFMAFAPDALTPLGGYPGDEDKAREAFAKLDQAKTRAGLPGRRGLAAGARRRQRQARCGGLLLRRRHRALAGDAAARPARRRCRSTATRPAPEEAAQGQGAAAGAPGRRRRAHQRRMAGLRGRAQGGGREVRRCTSTPAPSTASTTTPRRATTPPRPSWPGSARSPSSRPISIYSRISYMASPM